MQTFIDVWDFIRERQDRFNELLIAHIQLSLTALLLAALIFIPLGILLSRSDRYGSAVVGVVSSLRVIPSIALIILVYPLVGFGTKPALLALIVLAGPPIILNTYAGLRAVDRSTLEAASGLGMNPAQAFLRVQLPLALPVIAGGLRSASVEVIASATLASLIGVKGLGQYIFTGISLLDTTYLLAGGIPIVLLVLISEVVFGTLERVLTPPGYS